MRERTPMPTDNTESLLPPISFIRVRRIRSTVRYSRNPEERSLPPAERAREIFREIQKSRMEIAAAVERMRLGRAPSAPPQREDVILPVAESLLLSGENWLLTRNLCFIPAQAVATGPVLPEREAFQAFNAQLRRVEKAARASFLADRLAEWSERDRPHGEDLKDLERRLIAAMESGDRDHALPFDDAAREQNLASCLSVAPSAGLCGAFERFRIIIMESQRDAPFPHDDWSVEEAESHLRLWSLWPQVLSDWRAARTVPPRHVYRYPVELSGLNRVLAGKRFGKAHEIPVNVVEESGKPAKIVVTAPSGAQIELGATGRAVLGAGDYDDHGALKAESVTGLISKVTGPQVAMMGHVAFALAHIHAAQEGRQADGRFWLSPSEVGDLLGYRRESNGNASTNRIGREATKTIRKNFQAYAGTVITQTTRHRDGSTATIAGPLLYPTLKDHSERKAGQKGRDRRVEWRIRDELWALLPRRYIAIPIELLHRGNVPSDTWAHCIRLYEVLHSHAMNNTAKAAAGDLAVSFEWLESEGNLLGRSVRPDIGRRQTLKWLDLLAERGALAFERADLKKGPGVRYTLPEPRRAELAAVAGKAAQLKAITSAQPKRR